MISLWIFFAVLQVASVCLTVIVLQRLYAYIHRYRFDESKYTLLFGFVHLRWISTAYLTMMIVWVATSYFIFTLV